MEAFEEPGCKSPPDVIDCIEEERESVLGFNPLRDLLKGGVDRNPRTILARTQPEPQTNIFQTRLFFFLIKTYKWWIILWTLLFCLKQKKNKSCGNREQKLFDMDCLSTEN